MNKHCSGFSRIMLSRERGRRPSSAVQRDDIRRPLDCLLQQCEPHPCRGSIFCTSFRFHTGMDHFVRSYLQNDIRPELLLCGLIVGEIFVEVFLMIEIKGNGAVGFPDRVSRFIVHKNSQYHM